MLYISAIKIVLLFGFPTWKSNPEWTLVLLVCKVMCVINLELDRVVEEGGKVEQILKDTLLSIPSPSPSVKIKIMGVKVCLRCKGKTFLGVINKLFVFKSLLTMPSNVLLLHLKHTLPPIIWIFTKGDGIESKLPFKMFSTLPLFQISWITTTTKITIYQLSIFYASSLKCSSYQRKSC